MSASSAALPGSAAAGSPSAAWREIPALAARLLWRHWPAMLFFFFAQRVAYDLLMDAAIALSAHSVLVTFAALSLLIVTQLAGTIAMFLALRPSMPSLAHRALPDARSPRRLSA